MRLTLRTMLAYLDDVLEPSDAQDLGHKIEESKFASEIVERIRNATRRPRLAAPRLEARGMGGDPNTVAEYLDNVLPADRVPEFEKVCLESDVHLAETASCHQILTLVLGQPADVEASTRERIHRIGAPSAALQKEAPASASVDAAPAPLAAVAAPPSPAEPPQPPGSDVLPRKPEVPDYLREEPQTRWWQFLLVLCLVFVLCATVIVAMGPLNDTHPLASILGLKKGEDDKNSEGLQPPVITGPNEKPPAKPSDPTDKGTGDKGTGDNQAAEGPATPTDKGESRPKPMPADPKPLTPAVPTDPNPTGVPRDTPAPMTPTPLPPTTPTTPAPLNPAVPAPMPVPAPVDPAAIPAAPMPPEVKPAANDAGRYISEDELLVVTKPDKSWSRLAPRSALASGTRVVALPGHHPSLLLSGGAVQVTLDGGTIAVIHSPDERGVSQVQIVSGRAHLLTVGVAGAPVKLIAGGAADGRSGMIVFSDADSAVAVEVKRFLDPGADPQEGVAHRLIELQTTAGSITWSEGDQPGMPIRAAAIRWSKRRSG